MPLPSSGNQIALSQIRNEFGLGSGQIAMSQLYGKGNAPASSGAIFCGGHFHCTASFTGLANTTVNSGTHVIKAGLNHVGYSNTNAHSAAAAFGSIGSRTISGTSTLIDQVYWRDDSPSGLGALDNLRIAFSTANFTGWTTLTVSRANGSAQYVLNRSAATITSNGYMYYWQYPNSTTNPFVGQTAAIVQLT